VKPVKNIYAVVGVAAASVFTGWIVGLFWILGNRVSGGLMFWIVVLALVTNMVVAAIHYYLLRGAVHQADGGLGLLLLLMPVNLVITLGVAAATAGAIGAGTTVKMGAHFFSWGLSYAYGQAIHDVRHGTWVHE
jgi:hypothetical protein